MIGVGKLVFFCFFLRISGKLCFFCEIIVPRDC